MNIVMLTNTYTPHVGGVARSVEAFTAEYRRCGHRVLVVAPAFDDMPRDEADVVRIPAIQNFNGSDFSAVLPVSGLLTEALDAFRPDIVHSHHPYLLGMTALRVARYRELPLVFTHHTLYEQYTHYVPGDSPALRRFVIELATRYANLCDQVFAPSESIATLLRERGVEAPIAVVPTGVNLERFAQGDAAGFRRRMGIPDDVFVVGHLGRLAPEKNLVFLAEAVAAFLKTEPRAHFLLVGKGPSEADIRAIFERVGLSARLHVAGILDPAQLAAAYHAMDVFAFASRSETQGMVLTEAMAAGMPVVGLDAPGVREVVKDRHNGRLLHEESIEAFRVALQWVAQLPEEGRRQLKQSAVATAEDFSMPRSAATALGCYEALRARVLVERTEEDAQWEHVLHLIEAEWAILKGLAGAAVAAFGGPEAQDQGLK
ncbi:MAG: glycosyltransferase [Gammaproteobacteria bacterium]|nr:glycosyltransferase [Gammaproteobacteria bacterium]